MDPKKKEIDRENLTSEERGKLINQTLDVPETESPDFELKSDDKKEEPKYTESYEITTVKPGEKAEDKEEEIKAAAAEKKTEPTAEEKVKQGIQEVYDKLISIFPEFKEKYKTADEFISATKEPEPTDKKTDEPVEPVELLKPDEREEIIIEKAHSFFAADPVVQDLLQKIGMTKVPITFEDWQEMHKLDQENNQSNFASSQVLAKFNSYKSSVEKQVAEIEKTMGSRGKLSEEASKEFIDGIEAAVKQLHPGITSEQAKPFVEKMKTFFAEAVKFENGKPAHPEYFKMVNGILLPNGKALKSGFLAEHTDVLTEAVKLASGTKKPESSLKQQLEEKSKNSGNSIKTLANLGHNTGSTKTVYTDTSGSMRPEDRENLSSRERQGLLKALNEEIQNT